MANKRQLAKLRQGVDVWNDWRLQHSTIENPDLSNADLSNADLSGANLFGANLFGANLFGANLSGADLRYADLSGADLSGARFFGTKVFGANLNRANLSGANLSGAEISRVHLSNADLSEAIGFYPRVATVETAERHEIEVEIALPQENINESDLEQLLRAIDNLMDVCQFELKEEHSPVRGSWWQTLIFRSKEHITQAAANRVFEAVKDVFVARSTGIPSAEEIAKLAEAVDRVLKSLEPFESGVIRLGKLLVIKGKVRGKPILRVETISHSLVQKLAANPQLIKMPGALLDLINKGEEEKAKQAAS